MYISAREKELSILIPTYNESNNLPELTKRLYDCLFQLDYEIVFVDDNSPDKTADLAETLNFNSGNIKILRRPSKMGLGSAIIDGLKVSNGRIIAVMDADLQHPEYFGQLIQ